MKKTILGNYLTQPHQDFPLDCELFDNIQNNMEILSALGNIAGDKMILCGCEMPENGTKRQPGYVFLRTNKYPEGEVLYFAESSPNPSVTIKSDFIPTSTQINDYPGAYSYRHLEHGIGDESYNWEDFRHIRSCRELAEIVEEQDKLIKRLTPPRPGTVEMWAGEANKIDTEYYRLCDGTQLLIADFPELYEAIGRLHTPAHINNKNFCLPDLRSRFVVGYNSGVEEYNAPGKTGGLQSVALAEENTPPHKHSFDDYFFIEKNTVAGCYTGRIAIGDRNNGAKGDDDNNCIWYKTHDTHSAGAGIAHENRPPFYTMCYVIRIK